MLKTILKWLILSILILGAPSTSLSNSLFDDARILATNNKTIVQVEGSAMVPYFDSGSLLVIKNLDIDKIKEGMITVYINKFGQKVVKRVEKELKNRCWRVEPYGEKERSTELTENNLIGIVYAVLNSIDKIGVDNSLKIDRVLTMTRAPF